MNSGQNLSIQLQQMLLDHWMRLKRQAPLLPADLKHDPFEALKESLELQIELCREADRITEAEQCFSQMLAVVNQAKTGEELEALLKESHDSKVGEEMK